MATDRAKDALRGFVLRVMAFVGYHPLFPARVAKQNADGTLELVPDAATLPGLSKVPIRYGIPGVRVTVAANARVLLGFEGGDPRKPFAALWESGSVTKLEIDGTEIVLNGGSAKVARVGDDVTIDLSGTTLTGTIAGSPATMTVTGGSASGTIASGADGVKA